MVQSLKLYKDGALWRFDDLKKNLLAEPFVSGPSEIFDKLKLKLRIKTRDILLHFSDDSFFGADIVAVYANDYVVDKDGNKVEVKSGAYYAMEFPDEKKVYAGWLCPATLRYFEDYPKNLYVRVEPLHREWWRNFPIYSSKIMRPIMFRASMIMYKIRRFFPIEYKQVEEQAD